MIEREAMPPLSGDAIDRIKAHFDEPGWLADSRRAAWARYEAMPMPSRSDERWRRTDVSKLDWTYVRPMTLNARVETEFGFARPEENLHEWARVRDDLTRQGVSFGAYEEAMRGDGERFNAFIGKLMAGAKESQTGEPEGGIPADANKFELLTRAVGTDGYAVYVPRGVDVAVPLRARVVTTESTSVEGHEPSDLVQSLENSLEGRNVSACVYPRSVIVAEPFSRVTVVEEFTADNGAGPYLSSGLTEIYVGEGAEVTIVSLQEWSGATWNFHTQRSHVARDGKIVTLSVNLGGKVTKSNVEGVLLGENAGSRMLGVLFGEAHQHFDIYTLQDHQGNASTSDLLFKTALREESKAIYSGLIRVDEGVVGADAYQANRNLMLSGQAKADSQPMLEILNNDVRCTHGATMGPVDQEQLFYLQSRGLPREDAERIVVQGFFGEALDPVKDADVRAWLQERIASKIGGVEILGEPHVEGFEVEVG